MWQWERMTRRDTRWKGIQKKREGTRGTKPRPATISLGMLMNLSLNESIPRPCGDLEITLMDTLTRDSFQRDGDDDNGVYTVSTGLPPGKFYHDGRTLSPNVLWMRRKGFRRGTSVETMIMNYDVFCAVNIDLIVSEIIIIKNNDW